MHLVALQPELVGFHIELRIKGELLPFDPLVISARGGDLEQENGWATDLVTQVATDINS